MTADIAQAFFQAIDTNKINKVRQQDFIEKCASAYIFLWRQVLRLTTYISITYNNTADAGLRVSTFSRATCLSLMICWCFSEHHVTHFELKHKAVDSTELQRINVQTDTYFLGRWRPIVVYSTGLRAWNCVHWAVTYLGRVQLRQQPRQHTKAISIEWA